MDILQPFDKLVHRAAQGSFDDQLMKDSSTLQPRQGRRKQKRKKPASFHVSHASSPKNDSIVLGKDFSI